jgi:hypothetical protein
VRQITAPLANAGGIKGAVVDPVMERMGEMPRVAKETMAMANAGGGLSGMTDPIMDVARSVTAPSKPATPAGGPYGASVRPIYGVRPPMAPVPSLASVEQSFVDEVKASPERQQFMARQAEQLAALGGVQSRLAASGNSQLGGMSVPPVPGVNETLAGKMAGMGDMLENRALGRSGIAGNVRGNQFNTGSTAFASGPLADAAPRQSSFDEARRQSAIQMMETDPNAVASRQRMQDTYGPVADPSVVLAGGLPAMARRTDLTSEQKMGFAAKRAAFQAEREARMANSADWRAQRAQARRGFMLDGEGNLDPVATAGLRDPRMAVASQQALLAGRELGMREEAQKFAQSPDRFAERMKVAQALSPLQQLELNAAQQQIAEQPVMDAIEGNRALRDLSVGDQIGQFNDVKAAMAAGGMPAAIKAAAAFTDDQLIAMMEHDPWDFNPFSSSATDQGTKDLITQILAARKAQVAQGQGG